MSDFTDLLPVLSEGHVKYILVGGMAATAHGSGGCLNFTLTTTLGPIDLLGEIAGGGTYDALLPHTEYLHAFGRDTLVLNLEKLIAVKRAAGRPKDFEAIAELELILEMRTHDAGGDSAKR